MDFVDEFVREYLPDAESLARKKVDLSRGIMCPSQDSYEESIKKITSSTTIFAFTYDNGNGVLMAADRRTAAGLDIFSDQTEKIHPVSPFTAVAFCGTVYIASEIKEILSLSLGNHVTHYGFVSVDGQVKFLTNLLKSYFQYLLIFGLWRSITIPIFTAFDPGYEQARVFYYEPAGNVHERDDYVGEGCGWPSLQGLMSKYWKRDRPKKEAIKLAVSSMYQSGVISHGVSDSRISSPSMITIDESGVQVVEDNEIKKLVRREERAMEKNREAKE